MNILITFIPTVIVLFLLIKINAKNPSKEFGGDFIAHFAMVKTINSNNNKIPLKHPKVPEKLDILVRGTRFYHWLIAILPQKFQSKIFSNHKIYFLLISYTIYTFVYIRFIPLNSTNTTLFMFFIFTILYLFAPYQHNYQEARNFFSIRPIGELLVSSAFIIYILIDSNIFFSYLAIFICFSIVILISKFSRQVILFSVIPISILNKDIFYFIAVVSSFLFLSIFSKKTKLAIQSQYYHLKYFWLEMYSIALKHGWIPYSIKKLLSIRDLKSFIRVFPRINFLMIFLDYPIIWICFFNIILNKKNDKFSSILLSIIFIAFITSFNKLRVFGEGKRYLDYITILSILYAIKNLNNEYLLFVSIYSVIFSAFYLTVGYKTKRIKKEKKSNKDIKELLNFLNNDVLSTYYCQPSRLNCLIEAFTQHRLLCPTGWEPWQNDFNLYSDLKSNIKKGEISIEIDNDKIKRIKENYDVNRILLLNNYSLKDKKNTKIIFKNKEYSLFEI